MLFIALIDMNFASFKADDMSVFFVLQENIKNNFGKYKSPISKTHFIRVKINFNCIRIQYSNVLICTYDYVLCILVPSCTFMGE